MTVVFFASKTDTKTAPSVCVAHTAVLRAPKARSSSTLTHVRAIRVQQVVQAIGAIVEWPIAQALRVTAARVIAAAVLRNNSHNTHVG